MRAGDEGCGDAAALSNRQMVDFAKVAENGVMRPPLSAFLGALLALVVWSASHAQPQAPASAARVPDAPAQAEAADVYIFNDSGRTLVPGNQVVTADGARVASLPRQTYAVVRLPPGRHLLKPDPPLWKQEVVLDVAPGQRYFVVVAYKPERSWAAPFAGAPLLLRQVTEQEAAPLLQEMKPQ